MAARRPGPATRHGGTHGQLRRRTSFTTLSHSSPAATDPLDAVLVCSRVALATVARLVTPAAIGLRERRAAEEWHGQHLATTWPTPSGLHAYAGPNPSTPAELAQRPVVRALPVPVQLSSGTASSPTGTAWRGRSKREPVGCFSRRGCIFHPELAAPQQFRSARAVHRHVFLCTAESRRRTGWTGRRCGHLQGKGSRACSKHPQRV
jgi:hypothetical protein